MYNLQTGSVNVCEQSVHLYQPKLLNQPNRTHVRTHVRTHAVLTVKHTLHTQNGEDRVTGVFQVEVRRLDVYTTATLYHCNIIPLQHISNSSLRSSRFTPRASLLAQYKNYKEGEEGVQGETWKANMNVLLRIILCYLGSTTSRLASDRCSLWRSLERREKNPHAQPNLKTLEGWIEVELSFERKREENEEGYECRAFRWCKGPTGRVQVKHWDLDRKFLEEMPGKEGVPGIEVNIVEDYILKESQQEKETQARELQQQLDLEKQRQQHQIQVQQQQQQQQQLHYLHHQQQQPQVSLNSARTVTITSLY